MSMAEQITRFYRRKRFKLDIMLVFHAGDYLRATRQAAAEPMFLDQVPLRFGMSQDDHYHVPLLLSAHGYSTYRGS